MAQTKKPSAWDWIIKGHFRIVKEIKPGKWILTSDFSDYKTAAESFDSLSVADSIKSAFVYDSTI